MVETWNERDAVVFDSRCYALIRDGWRRAREVYADFASSFESFRAHVETTIATRLERATEEDETAHSLLRRLNFADLYLAFGCEQKDEAAWRIVSREFGKGIYWRLRRMGASHEEAAEASEDFPGWWATPPRHGSSKTAFGGFLGIGSLRGYVLMVEARRWTRRLSDPLRRWLSIHTSTDLPAESEPVGRVIDDPKGYQIIDAAWRRLDARTRAAMLFKFVHGLKQREIAGIFEISESRVSRILGKASEQLEDALSVWIESGILPSAEAATSALWTRMQASRASSPYRRRPDRQ